MTKKPMTLNDVGHLYMRTGKAALVALAALTMLFATTTPVNAAGPGEPGVLVSVPSAFYCGDNLFQAGDYTIGEGPALNILAIQLMGLHTPSWVPAIPERSPSAREGKASLVFLRYPDGKNYLREIRNPSASSHYFSQGRIEKRSVMGQDSLARAALLAIAARNR